MLQSSAKSCRITVLPIMSGSEQSGIDLADEVRRLRVQVDGLEEEAARLRGRDPTADTPRVAVHAAEVVRDVLISAGQESAVFDAVELSAVVRGIVRLLAVSARLRPGVRSLVVNASVALGDKEDLITITASPCRSGPEPAVDYIRLEVGGTGGAGFEPAAIEGIVRSHGGVVHAASAPGQGSRLEILLPCDNRQAAPPVAAAPAPEAITQAATVLVVEDEVSLRVPVAKLLRRRGFAVLEAVDGHTAVTLFQAKEPEIDVVLLDMTLPTMSGPEVLEEMRRLRSDVKVILTSAYGPETVMRAVDGAPPLGYIRKPYSPSEVADLLWKACLPKQG